MKSLIWVTTLTKLGSEHLSVFKEKKNIGFSFLQTFRKENSSFSLFHNVKKKFCKNFVSIINDLLSCLTQTRLIYNNTFWYTSSFHYLKPKQLSNYQLIC